MKTYLVGGAVRDTLLGYPFHERDWVVVGATPQQLLAQGYQQVGKDFPVFLHPETKEEYALARTERKNGQGYSGFACYSAPDVSLEDDLLRRDLSINAIAQDEKGNIIDPYQGQQDIAAKKLRHVSPAFAEDPLRVLRTARFLARYHHLGFSVAEETLQLMQQLSSSGELQHLSRERIWVETEKALSEQSPQQYFLCLQHCGALAQLYPPMPALTEQSATRLQQASKNCSPAQRFALLFYQAQNQDLLKQLKALKVPNEVAELCQLFSLYADTVIAEQLSAQQALQLLQNCDAYRRGSRFALFLQCCQQLSQHNHADKLNLALTLCLSVDAKALAAQGLSGKAIALAIEQQRLNLLSEILP
ncbi:multifunctional CCA tRNA nucleotidyl transferase/2'3'-cyclic phosphodiesterase/2'nucleotidase/phosphatase [Dasania sp. GY-MA-18]|uniref:CCA-adding enzyme n=1 Tax=Dasania phycosphaerae TaxID=2950436 RepID=A0A9J6RL71_9GAMM|nr:MULTISPECIES: multifunctional CCA tRNA nucleotidyl transferase/2'3'-cyclic phosphodiesterase/2'nucleotidase/phosphatase [Dasania]MCR8922321.1 multifunctional CCA tRNA nucleotidyl transferase/2'3'-cyclic phosphodiesterase/2'nucleotidase/phosphatase [Dasania sp. GY-MA-18]MCZ0864749.1 multifunctional CCA tRNA nucleotidyl transferase/2'3'-cyclic phosphodiesterase/2'nucleotidase/phosphatase [Dasania phycosphaerae]MCZ0868477.1 multifunctional CCA tRNA nucleotidyl transferase/2'3'-cyclic phosphodies